jgi:hypothetical protein
VIAPDVLIIVAGIGLFLGCVVFAPWIAVTWFALSVIACFAVGTCLRGGQY